VAKLEAIAKSDNVKLENNDKSRVDLVKSTERGSVLDRDLSYDNIIATQENRIGYHGNVSFQGLTTAELAIQTSTNKAAWNNWARSDRIGEVRRHPQAGAWRLAGKAAAASGGPARWLWEPAG
jgi:hypothetical protein